MARITIINGDAGDDTVIVDGRTLHFPIDDLLDDPAIWAVQWHNNSGEIEFTDKPPEEIEDLDRFAPVLNKYNELIDAEDNPEPLPATTRREMAKRDIDGAAGFVRQAFVSNGQLIEEEYRLVKQLTEQWRAAGSPADDVPTAISVWAASVGLTDEQGAQSIEAATVQLEGVLITVRNIRLTGKGVIDNASDDTDFAVLAQPYINQLNALIP